MSNICHKTGLIKDQLESGLYHLKRVGFYLRKIAQSKKTCATELGKFSEHELEKVSHKGERQCWPVINPS